MGPKPEFLEHISQRRAALRTELAALVPATAAIVLEIGCGHGHFSPAMQWRIPPGYVLGST